jgi:TonB family protein
LKLPLARRTGCWLIIVGMAGACSGCTEAKGRGEAKPEGQYALKTPSNTDIPRRLEGAVPEYATEVGRREVQGVVVLEVTIGPSGAVSTARLVRGIEPVLDKAAVDAALTWKYQPPLVRGKPATLKLIETVTYRRDGEKLFVTVSNRPGRRTGIQ